MDGPEIYTNDRKPPGDFLRRLKAFDPDLTCKWNHKRGIFEILRPKDPVTLAALRAQGTNEPWDMILECAETLDTEILDADGIICRMRLPKEPGDWVFPKLKSMDSWSHPGGIEGANRDFIANADRLFEEKRAMRRALHEANLEEGHIAICRDLNIARARVPVGVHGTRGWRR